MRPRTRRIGAVAGPDRRGIRLLPTVILTGELRPVDRARGFRHKRRVLERYLPNTVPCGIAVPEAPCGQLARSKVSPGLLEPASRKSESTASWPVARSSLSIHIRRSADGLGSFTITMLEPWIASQCGRWRSSNDTDETLRTWSRSPMSRVKTRWSAAWAWIQYRPATTGIAHPLGRSSWISASCGAVLSNPVTRYRR